MKYLFKTLIIFTIIFFALKLILFIFDTGHIVTYNVRNFKVKEELKTKDNNNYYFSLEHEDFKINFQINQNYNKSEKIINKIEYKKIDGYNCVLPIFKNGKILTDVMCLKDNTIMYAHNLNNKKIDDYLKSLDKYGYNKEDYQDKADDVKLSNTQTIYKDNFLENHYIAMETYKGLNLFNGNESNVQIFDNDVYTKPISFFTDKYYIVADYTDTYTFKIFHVINIINGKQIDIRSYDDISFDSYIEGAIGDDIYLFDKDASKQYKISIQNESVEEFNDKNSLQTYNGKWENMTLSEALNEKTFNNYHTKDIKGYDKVDKVGNYYYIYEKENDHYNVYRSDIQNKTLKTYLFETTNLNSVIYLDDTIYYINGNTFYYHNNYGERKIITNTELQFNSDLSFGVYKK